MFMRAEVVSSENRGFSLPKSESFAFSFFATQRILVPEAASAFAKAFRAPANRNMVSKPSFRPQDRKAWRVMSV